MGRYQVRNMIWVPLKTSFNMSVIMKLILSVLSSLLQTIVNFKVIDLESKVMSHNQESFSSLNAWSAWNKSSEDGPWGR